MIDNELIKKAESGDAEAMYRLGNQFLEAGNADQAVLWIYQAHENGNLDASFELGRLMVRSENYDEALECLSTAAEADSENGDCAAFLLATMYSQGKGVPTNESESFQWLSKICNRGRGGEVYKQACYLMGLRLRTLQLENKRDELLNIQKMLHGEKITASAGQPVLESPYPWFKRAAAQGHFEAMYQLANAFFDGEYTDISEEEALRWMKQASNGGVASAKIFLAGHYDKSDGSPEEHRLAHDLYLDLIQNREKYDLSDETYTELLRSLAFLTHCLLKDFKESIGFWRELAKQKDPDGIYWLALCHFYGWGTESNLEIARMFADKLEPIDPKRSAELYEKFVDGIFKTIDKSKETQKSGGCYVATAVYGSYDCPEVWTLRRFRDYTLDETWYGRAFIKVYYAVSPTLVKWFGETKWFQRLWKGKLDRLVARLQSEGVESTPYQDKKYR